MPEGSAFQQHNLVSIKPHLKTAASTYNQGVRSQHLLINSMPSSAYRIKTWPHLLHSDSFMPFFPVARPLPDEVGSFAIKAAAF